MKKLFSAFWQWCVLVVDVLSYIIWPIEDEEAGQ